MILDKIEYIKQYSGISENLDTVIDFIAHNDIKVLPCGKTIINDNVFVNVFEYDLSPEIIPPFEAHKEYGDLHVLGYGEEMIRVCSIDDLKIEQAMPQDDCWLGESNTFTPTIVSDQQFLIVFPQDAHSVKNYHHHAKAKKIVFKFKV